MEMVSKLIWIASGYLASMVLVYVLPGFAADAVKWGPADNGVRMAVGLANLQIHVSLQNVGEKDVLIPVGITVDRPHPMSFTVHLRRPSGATAKVIYTGIGIVAGYAELMTVALHAGETLHDFDAR